MAAAVAALAVDGTVVIRGRRGGRRIVLPLRGVLRRVSGGPVGRSHRRARRRAGRAPWRPEDRRGPGLPHLDTGATYRAATRRCARRRRADPYDAAAVLAAVSGVPIRFEAGPGLARWRRHLVRDPRSAEVASGGEAGLRPPGGPADHRRAQQRAWVVEHGGDAVVEGRDIGTVVFPDAATKVFLTARPEVRAARLPARRGGPGRSAASRPVRHGA